MADNKECKLDDETCDYVDDTDDFTVESDDKTKANFDKNSLQETQDEISQGAYDGLMDRYQRTLAEYDNFRKRTLREKANSYDSGVRDAIEKLLPVLDNFERALVAHDDKSDTFYQGVEMIARQLETFIADMGIEPIAGQGESFDPNLHFAVAHVEDEKYGTGEVIEELQKGYIYKGKVIRPSMVRVAN